MDFTLAFAFDGYESPENCGRKISQNVGRPIEFQKAISSRNL